MMLIRLHRWAGLSVSMYFAYNKVSCFLMKQLNYYLGLEATKPVFGVSDKARLKPACSVIETS